ncbi:hypothetical protein, partial [Avibacterium paragallinarum]|uniref:hypothetical protein n=1 Tax=Avibacterium paragallinarum TaxID=728 RepID=UPI003985AC93
KCGTKTTPNLDRTLHFFSKNWIINPQGVEGIIKQQKNEKFLQKGVAKILKKPIIRRTQRRDVVNKLKVHIASLFFAL